MTHFEDWDLPDPFILSVTVQDNDIDTFGHANNAVYLTWADEAAWAHWIADGYTRQQCIDADRGMAIMETQARYLGHLKAGDTINCAVWIPNSDGKLRAERWYQFRRADNGETVFRARTKLVCFQLSTGRPARMISGFKGHYDVPPERLAKAAKNIDWSV